MNWNEGGYSLVPYNGVVPGSWGAGGFDESLYGGLPLSGWGAAGFGEVEFDALAIVPIDPEKPKIPDSIKWGFGGLVTPVRRFNHKSKLMLRNEAILLAIVR